MKRENLYTQARWDEVEEKNKRLMQLHLRFLKGERRRPRTINQYFFDIRMFLIWNLLFNDNMSVLDFKKMHFDKFKYYMIEQRDASNARVNRLMSAIRTMMNYAADDDMLFEDYLRNPAERVKGLPQNPRKETAFLTDEQIVLLREYLREHKMYKWMFLIDIFYDSGARISEVFQVENVSTVPKGYIKVECKGGKYEYLLIQDRAKESLELYLPEVKDRGCFWLSDRGEPLKSESTIREWVGKMRKILQSLDSTTPYFTPHSFRHTFIENMSNGTHYLCGKLGRKLTTEEVQLIVHHKSIDMTKSYMKPKDNEIILGLFGINVA